MEVSEEALAIDVTKSVGSTGTFFDQDHTLKHMRSEFFFPRVGDRLPREEWVRRGAIDGRERAREIAKDILANYKPTPLWPETEMRIKETIPGLVA